MIVHLVARALEAPLGVGEVDAGPAAAIVVLGAPLTGDGRLSEVGAERLAGGVALWHAGAAPRLVLSGGVTRRGARAEAEVMADAARAGGVPADALIVEAQSRTTVENAREVARLIDPGAAVWVVTQPFHGRRARRCFRDVGLEPRIWHLADSLQYRDRGRALRWLVREYGAWARLVVVGPRSPRSG